MANQKIKEHVDKGWSTQDLLDDRIDPNDGLVWWNGCELIANSWTNVFVRTAAGDYSMSAVGAGTWRAVASLSPMARVQTAKGLKILDVAFHYTITAVAGTTVDVTIQKAVYANAATPTVTNIPFTYDTSHDTNAKRITVASHLLIATITAPEFEDVDLTWYSAEFVAVMPGGATIAMRAAAMHVAHDLL